MKQFAGLVALAILISFAAPAEAGCKWHMKKRHFADSLNPFNFPGWTQVYDLIQVDPYSGSIAYHNMYQTPLAKTGWAYHGAYATIHCPTTADCLPVTTPLMQAARAESIKGCKATHLPLNSCQHLLGNDTLYTAVVCE
jgi:hypothetical protein